MAPTATQAHAQAGEGDSVIGWTLDADQRKELLQQFPPRYPNIDADHVTLRPSSADDAPLPDESHGEIIGRVDDGKGVEAMIVHIDGTSDRPDGSSYHVTWSLAEGRHGRESNEVLKSVPWRLFDLPMPIRLIPARFP